MKKIVVSIFCVILALSLFGCGNSTKVDINSLADDMVEKVQYSEEMKSITVDYYVDLPDGAEAVGYMSTGTSGEEFIAIECSKSSETEDVATQLEELLADQLDQATKYQPEQAELLKNSEVQQYGNVVILSVASDTDTANSIIKEYLG